MKILRGFSFSDCGTKLMKRTNNKFRNNYNNQIYSLNYKFDSNSVAGKISGTALDLIKRYNELAKDAHSNNDYVTAEVFRQYAEHYRKIVTEINEKKNQNQNQNQNFKQYNNQQPTAEPANTTSESVAEQNNDAPAVEEVKTVAEDKSLSMLSIPEKKAFTVIEIPTSEAQALNKNEETPAKPKRAYRRKAAAAE